MSQSPKGAMVDTLFMIQAQVHFYRFTSGTDVLCRDICGLSMS